LIGEERVAAKAIPNPFQLAEIRPAPATAEARNMPATAVRAESSDECAPRPPMVNAATPASSTNTAAGNAQVRGLRLSQPADGRDDITCCRKSGRTGTLLRCRRFESAKSS